MGDERITMSTTDRPISDTQAADTHGADTAVPDEPILEMREVRVVRGGTRILDRVTFSLRRGEHAVILGPNGSGKSTLVKLISGQIYPSAPHTVDPPIRVFGRERWNLEELRSRLGLVSTDLQQRFVVGSSMGRATAHELVIASFFGSGGVPFLHHQVTPEIREKALEALVRVEAGHLARRRLAEVSTGEARRILIARALAHGPEVLVLDEPTTGLDLVARHAFIDTLRRLAAEEATLILVTHHVEEVIPEVTRVLVMRRGRIHADGTPADVLTEPILGEAYGAPVRPNRREGRWELRMGDASVSGAAHPGERSSPKERND